MQRQSAFCESHRWDDASGTFRGTTLRNDPTPPGHVNETRNSRFRTPSPSPWRSEATPALSETSDLDEDVDPSAVMHWGDPRAQRGRLRAGTHPYRAVSREGSQRRVPASGGDARHDAQRDGEDRHGGRPSVMVDAYNLARNLGGVAWNSIKIISWATGCEPHQVVIHIGLFVTYKCFTGEWGLWKGDSA